MTELSPPSSPSSKFTIENLHDAIKEHDMERVKLIVRTQRELLEEVIHVEDEDDELLPMHFAAWLGHTDILELFISQYGKDVNQRTSFQSTPLHWAHNVETARWLLQHCADLNAVDNNLCPPLFDCAVHKKPEIVELLISQYGADMTVRDSAGGHVLCWAGNAAVARVLLAHGADINSRSNDGDTPLHQASLNDRIDVIHVLMEHGANVEARSNKGYTPLMYAGSVSTMRVLIEQYGASITVKSNNDRTLLHTAPSIVAFTVENKLDVNALDNLGQNPLHVKARNGDMMDIATLVALGANLDAQDNNGDTPIICVLAYTKMTEDDVEKIRMMIDLGADATIPNKLGKAPIRNRTARKMWENRHDQRLKRLREINTQICCERRDFSLNKIATVASGFLDELDCLGYVEHALESRLSLLTESESALARLQGTDQKKVREETLSRIQDCKEAHEKRAVSLQKLERELEKHEKAAESPELRALYDKLTELYSQQQNGSLKEKRKNLEEQQQRLDHFNARVLELEQRRAALSNLLQQYNSARDRIDTLDIEQSGIELEIKKAKKNRSAGAVELAKLQRSREAILQKLATSTRQMEKLEQEIFSYSTKNTAFLDFRIAITRHRMQRMGILDQASQEQDGLRSLQIWLSETLHLLVNRSLHEDYAKIKTLDVKGHVFLEKLKGTDEKVVIKELEWTPEKDKRIRNEIRLMCELSHPNIVKIRAIFIEENTHNVCIEMEYCEKGELLRWAFQDPRPSFHQRKQALRQVLQAIAYLHDKNVIHRDVKPENVLIDGNGIVKLIDFGISKDLSKLVALTSTVTMHSQDDLAKLRGTLKYMAPEIRSREVQDATVETDMWSVGLLARELLFGALPVPALGVDVLQLPNRPDDVLPEENQLNGLIIDAAVTLEEKKAALDLCRKLLVDRVVATNALCHEFFINHFPMDKQEDNDDDKATCAVCLDAKVNRVLTCGHTVCDSCLRGLVAAGRVKCHTCRQQMNLQDVRNLYL